MDTRWKVRGTTEFLFGTRLSPGGVLRIVRGIVDEFASGTPQVTGHDARLVSEDYFVVELLMVASSFAQTDEVMRRLCAQIVDQFTPPGEANGFTGIAEQATELVPA